MSSGVHRLCWRLGAGWVMAVGGALRGEGGLGWSGVEFWAANGTSRPLIPIYGSPPLVSEQPKAQAMTGRFLVHMKFTRPLDVNFLGHF